MIYEAVFVVCTIAGYTTPWVGDIDTGPTCVEIERIAFPTERQCLTRLEDTLKLSCTEDEQKRLPLEGPYRFFSECRIKIAEGPLPCVDCKE